MEEDIQKVRTCGEDAVWCSDYFSDDCPKICKYAREEDSKEYRHKIIIEELVGVRL